MKKRTLYLFPHTFNTFTYHVVTSMLGGIVDAEYFQNVHPW